MEISARGRSGQMSFDGKFVTITREGFLAKATHGLGGGSKAIPVRSIGAVQFKPATSLTHGYIQLSIVGEQAKKFSRGSISGVGSDAAKDENSILFAKKVTKEFEALADAIRAAITGSDVPNTAPAAADPLQQIEQLAALLQAGHITQAEYDTKKAEILGRM